MAMESYMWLAALSCQANYTDKLGLFQIKEEFSNNG